MVDEDCAIDWITERDESIRQAEREKCRELVEALRPLRAVAGVLGKYLSENLGLWSKTSSEGADIRLTVGDVRRIKDALAKFDSPTQPQGDEWMICEMCEKEKCEDRIKCIQAWEYQHKENKMTEVEIKNMVDRFLNWRLPEDFHPDCGIHFDADAAKKLHPHNHRYEPIGTNLFTATQATEMVKFMLGVTQNEATDGK